MGRRKKNVLIDVPIPDSVLRNIDEYSTGGYLLFTFDSQGNPRITSNFDSQFHAIAMQFFIKNWINALDNINLDAATQSILSQVSSKRRKT